MGKNRTYSEYILNACGENNNMDYRAARSARHPVGQLAARRTSNNTHKQQQQQQQGTHTAHSTQIPCLAGPTESPGGTSQRQTNKKQNTRLQLAITKRRPSSHSFKLVSRRLSSAELRKNPSSPRNTEQQRWGTIPHPALTSNTNPLTCMYLIHVSFVFQSACPSLIPISCPVLVKSYFSFLPPRELSTIPRSTETRSILCVIFQAPAHSFPTAETCTYLPTASGCKSYRPNHNQRTELYRVCAQVVWHNICQ